MAKSSEFTWEGITATTAEKLRKPKVTPVPASIIELAQRSWDGVDGKHVLRHHFKEADRPKCEAFCRLMKKAGPHTSPATSVSVVRDPDETGDDLLVAWRAGTRRGRKAEVK